MTRKTGVAGGIAAGGLLLGGALLVLFFFDPTRVPIYPLCVFHRLTGLNCPGCGSLRAMHAMLHGDIGTALRMNAFLVLSLPLFAWLGFQLIRRWIKNENPVAIRTLWLWIYFGAFVVFGIVRELSAVFFATPSP